MYLPQKLSWIVAASLLLASFPGGDAAASEPYSYTAYYDGSNECDGTIVMLNAHVSGDDEFVIGASDPETSKCSIENMCLVDLDSDLCAEYVTNVSGIAHTDVNKDGNIFQCDTTNEDVDQDQCRYIRGCGYSSLFPNCRFILFTTSGLFENIDDIRNVNAYEDEDLALTSYVTYYSDDECSEFEGTQGIIAGETNLLSMSDSLSCEEAMACVFNPDGEACVNSGGLTGENVTIRTLPATSNAILCSDETDESCAEVDPTACSKSEAIPNCWYRLSTSYRLFAQPEMFLLSTKYPISIAADETDAPTVAPTAATASSSRPILRWSSWWTIVVVTLAVVGRPAKLS